MTTMGELNWDLAVLQKDEGLSAFVLDVVFLLVWLLVLSDVSDDESGRLLFADAADDDVPFFFEFFLRRRAPEEFVSTIVLQL